MAISTSTTRPTNTLLFINRSRGAAHKPLMARGFGRIQKGAQARLCQRETGWCDSCVNPPSRAESSVIPGLVAAANRGSESRQRGADLRVANACGGVRNRFLFEAGEGRWRGRDVTPRERALLDLQP